jgi:hypothetical protein
LFPERPVTLADRNDPSVSLDGTTLTINFGERWSEKVVLLDDRE